MRKSRKINKYGARFSLVWILKTFVPKMKLMKIWKLKGYSRGDTSGGRISGVTER